MKKIPVRQLAEAQNKRGTLEMFDIRRVADLFGEKDVINHELHRHDYFFILVLKRGSGVHEIDFNAFELSDNSIFVLRPGQVHQLVMNAGCTGYLLEFNSEFYDPANTQIYERLKKAGNRNFCKVEESCFDRMEAILSSTFNEYTERMDGYREVIKANLDIFLIELNRQGQSTGAMQTSGSSYPQERLAEFVGLLEVHLTNSKQVSFYTDLMSLSAYQLNEITKSLLGKTASEMINDQIVLEAKRYLLATPNQVKDIAYQLGYEDVSYFIRFFKKQTGHSPEAFRSSFR